MKSFEHYYNCALRHCQYGLIEGTRFAFVASQVVFSEGDAEILFLVYFPDHAECDVVAVNSVNDWTRIPGSRIMELADFEREVNSLGDSLIVSEYHIAKH